MQEDGQGIVTGEISEDDVTDKVVEEVTVVRDVSAWYEGFTVGERRGAADVLDALRETLYGVGFGQEDADEVLAKVRLRAGFKLS